MKAPRANLLCLVALACAGCSPTQSVPPSAVFLIVVDTLRPDHLSCYGYGRHETPAIDRLARSGVLFTRAESAASWTVPSMGAMFTSRYPAQLGLIEKPVGKKRFMRRERRQQLRATLPLSARTLTEMLSDRGFHTTGFVNQPFLNIYDGFLQGFQAWCYPNQDGATWHDLAQPLPTATRVPPGMEGGQADALMVEAFLEWIGSVEDGRHFVWIHLLRPHSPYIPPATFMGGDSAGADQAAAYDGEVRAADEAVGQILEAIDRHFPLEHCIVVFVSDHGEAFGEHYGVEHGHSLHTEVTHVPLIIRAPGLPAGHTVLCQVRTIDILPTILDLTGVTKQEAGIEGESLLGTMEGDCGDRPVYAEGMLYEGTERSLIQNEFRLMYEVDVDERYTLFDLSRDPLELVDVSGQQTTRVETMQVELQSLRARLLSDLQDDLTTGKSTSTREDDERVLRSLRALGYIK